MTDEELRDLVASIAIEQKQTAEQLKELSASQQEASQQIKELSASQKENDRQDQERKREFERLRKEGEQEIRELKREFEQLRKEGEQEARERKREIDQQLKELGKQIGGLGEKFGSFTEGLALPSMQKTLYGQFNMEVVSPSVRVSKAGQHLEIDVLAYANSDINEAYVVEVKSHLREEAIVQLQRILERFRMFFPEHKDKTVYGILAAVDISADMRERAMRAGFYVAHIRDDVFTLDVPANFKPKAY